MAMYSIRRTWARRHLVFVLVLLAVVLKNSGTSAVDQNRLLLFRQLPAGAHPPSVLEIRTQFKGSITFEEAEEFEMSVNITSMSNQRIMHNYTVLNGRALLQIYHSENGYPVTYLFPAVYVVAGVTLLAFLVSLVVLNVMNSKTRHSKSRRNTSIASDAMPISLNTAISDINHVQIPLLKNQTDSIDARPHFSSEQRENKKKGPDHIYGVTPAEPINGESSVVSYIKLDQPDLKYNSNQKVASKDSGNLPLNHVQGEPDQLTNGGTSSSCSQAEKKPGDDSLPTLVTRTSRAVKIPQQQQYDDEDDLDLPPPPPIYENNELRCKTLKKPSNGQTHEINNRYATISSKELKCIRPNKNLHSADSEDSNSSLITIIPKLTSNRECNTVNRAQTRGGAGATLTSKHFMAVALCLVSVTTAGMLYNPEAHIVVKVAPHVLSSHAVVYIDQNHNFDIVNNVKGLKIDRYDVINSRITNDMLSSPRCRHSSCQHNCDSASGACICRNGYKLVNGFECIDIDDCTSEFTKCHRYAECSNKDGGYICKCIEGYHGDGIHCQACNELCPEGTFEERPCSENIPKVCKKCSDKCKPGYYKVGKCLKTQDIQCTECRSVCGDGQFEFSPCHGDYNRKCQSIAELPSPKFHSNTIVEDRSKVQRVISSVIRRSFDDPVENEDRVTKFVLDRGSSLSVHVNLIKSQLSPLFTPQLLQELTNKQGDNEFYYGDRKVIAEFCPTPIPSFYYLKSNLYEGITTKATISKQSVHEQPQYTMDPNTPCKTYDQFGRLAPISPKSQSSIQCVGDSSLVQVFSHSDRLLDKTTMYVDKTAECASKRNRCDQCIKECGNKMVNYGQRNSHRCNVTADDADNGNSPRLRYCYSCCVNSDCDEKCKIYSDEKNCKQERCITGNIASFSLMPHFYENGRQFVCKVQASPNYLIYSLEFSIHLTSSDGLTSAPSINDRILKASQVASARAGHPRKAMRKHDFLNVYFGSEVEINDKDLTLIKGDISVTNSFEIGNYKVTGKDLHGIAKNENRYPDDKIIIQPRLPFLVNSQNWKLQDCDTNSLKDMLYDKAKQKNNVTMFNKKNGFSIRKTKQMNYELFNSSKNHQPFLYLEITKDVSLLQSLFRYTSVFSDHTLETSIQSLHNSEQLKVSLTVDSCPSAFNIKVYDDGNDNQNERDSQGKDDKHARNKILLYNHDVMLPCPDHTTSILYRIPTMDTNMDRTFQVIITDSYRSIHIKVVRSISSQNESMQTHLKALKDLPAEQNRLTLFSPSVIILLSVLSLFMLILLVSTVNNLDCRTAPASSPQSNPSSSLTTLSSSTSISVCVIMVTGKALYACLLSFSFLIVLLQYQNSDLVDTLNNLPEVIQSKNNERSLLIGQHRLAVIHETKRQNQLAATLRTQCQKVLQMQQDHFVKIKDKLTKNPDISSNVNRLISKYVREMIIGYTKEIKNFKSEFNIYTEKELSNLKKNMLLSVNSLKNNKWLAGPKLIYDEVKNKRKSANKDNVKSFLEWIGIEFNLPSFDIDLDIHDFPMPNLTAFLSIDFTDLSDGNLKTSKDEAILPENKWYHEEEEEQQKSSRGVQYNGNYGNDGEDDDDGAHQSAGFEGTAESLIGQLTSHAAVLILLLVTDVVWFAHRMASTIQKTKLFINRQQTINCNPPNVNSENIEDLKNISRTRMSYFYQIIKKIEKSDFIQKFVGVTSFLMVFWCILNVANAVLSAQFLADIGYYDSMTEELVRSESDSRRFIDLNAAHINTVEHPLLASLVSDTSQRFAQILDIYSQAQQRRRNELLREECSWSVVSGEISRSHGCNCSDNVANENNGGQDDLQSLNSYSCEFPTVVPRQFSSMDIREFRDRLVISSRPIVKASRLLLRNVVITVANFILILAIADCFGSVFSLGMLRYRSTLKTEETQEFSSVNMIS